jgi:hypothetical protein
MSDVIFAGFNIQIFKREGRYFVCYDAGGIAVEYREDEITAEEAAQAQKREMRI